jgi:hypothetical protein
MANLAGVIRVLQQEQNRLTREIKAISAALTAFGAAYGKGKQSSGRVSAAGRARIAAAQRARWAKLKGKSARSNVTTMPRKRTLSAAARRKIAAAQRARWAKLRAGKKTA